MKNIENIKCTKTISFFLLVYNLQTMMPKLEKIVLYCKRVFV